MKKFISAVAAAILIAGIFPAEAADIAILVVYRDGKLIYSTNTEKKGDGYTFVVSDDYKNDEYKVFCNEANPVECTIEYVDISATEVPEKTQIPEASAQPSNKPAEKVTPQPTRTPYPAVYEKALDAVNAPAVIEKIEETIVDGEVWYRTTMLYQGTEITTLIYNEVTVDSAPEAYSDLLGADVSALKAGDIIHFLCDLQGSVKTVNLIMRPTDAAAAQYGTDNYSKFYYGVPIKVAKGYITLMDADGNTWDVDISKNVFVYTIRPYARGGKVEFTGIGSGGIIRSNVNDAWNEACSYVLARVCRGTATELIQIEN